MVAPDPKSDKSIWNSDDPESSWLPVDMRSAMAAGEVLPDIGYRVDGAPLLYLGRVHWFFGTFESGKTFAALYFVAQELNAGQNVLYIDFEDDARGIGWRLAQLGVALDVIHDPSRFTYVRPDEPINLDFDPVLDRSYSLAVIDGVTESIALEGFKDSLAPDVAAWQSRLPRKVADRTGAATICLDHVPKDTDNHAMPSGSQHKMSGLNGAAYRFVCTEKIGKGKVGKIDIRVHKDRSGGVRGPLGVNYSAKDQSALVGRFVLDARDPANYVASIEVPDTVVTVSAKTGRPIKPDRLNFCKERLCEHITSATLPDGKRSGRAITEAMADVKYLKTAVGQLVWRDALKELIDDYYVYVVDGPRNSKLHYVSQMFIAGSEDSEDKRVKRKRQAERATATKILANVNAEISQIEGLE